MFLPPRRAWMRVGLRMAPTFGCCLSSYLPVFRSPRRRGQRGAPAAQRGRTTLTSTSGGRCCPRRKGSCLGLGACHLLFVVVQDVPRPSRGSGGPPTLRYAGRNRRSVIRRRMPLTKGARGRSRGIVSTGIVSAAAAARHVLQALLINPRSRTDEPGTVVPGGFRQWSSPPTRSRRARCAIAAATTDLLFLTSARRRKRPHRRV